MIFAGANYETLLKVIAFPKSYLKPKVFLSAQSTVGLYAATNRTQYSKQMSKLDNELKKRRCCWPDTRMAD